jgi:hypothetical protein
MSIELPSFAVVGVEENLCNMSLGLNLSEV